MAKIGESVTSSKTYKSYVGSGGQGQSWDMGVGVSGKLIGQRTNPDGTIDYNVDYSAAGGGTGWASSAAFAPVAAPAAGAGVAVPNISQAAATPPAQSAAQQDVTKYLNDYQAQVKDLTAKSNSMFKTEDEMKAEIQQWTTPGQPAPTAPKLVDLFNTLRSDNDITSLETNLNDLKAQEDELNAQLREQMGYEEGKPVPLSVIQGRVTEAQRQAMITLDFIGRQKTRVVDELNSRNSLISTIMNLTSQDYQNAVQSYQSEFNQKMAIYNAFSTQRQQQNQMVNDRLQFAEKAVLDLTTQMADWEREDIKRAEDASRANLEIYSNMLMKGNIKYSDLSGDQRLEVNKMELKAGLPQGFLSNIKSDAELKGAEIKSSTTRTSANGDKYVDLIMQNPDGSVTVKSQYLGKEYINTGSGSSLNATEIGNAAALKTQQVGATNLIKSAAGSDKLISKSEFNSVIDNLMKQHGDVALVNQLAAQAMIDAGASKWTQGGVWK